MREEMSIVRDQVMRTAARVAVSAKVVGQGETWRGACRRERQRMMRWGLKQSHGVHQELKFKKAYGMMGWAIGVLVAC